MTKELYDKVCAYRITMSVIKSMLKSNIIKTEEVFLMQKLKKIDMVESLKSIE